MPKSDKGLVGRIPEKKFKHSILLKVHAVVAKVTAA